jgi:hypothetical protein
MVEAKALWPVKLGLLSVALSWFSFTFYEFAFGIFNRTTVWPIVIQDIPGVLGMGFRTGAGFMAVITILLWIFKKNLSNPEMMMAVRFILIFEAATFVSLLPSGVYAFIFPSLLVPQRIIGSTLPVLTESIVIPIVLVRLFFALSPNKPVRNVIKWALISGVVYLFVFWLNYMGNWVYTLFIKGVEYITTHPVNLFSFCLTSIGLLLLASYSAYFARKSIGADSLSSLDTGTIGYIITFFGLYFVFTYFLWLIFGFVGGWSSWYAWFFNHNVDLWLLTAPILGLALILQKD